MVKKNYIISILAIVSIFCFVGFFLMRGKNKKYTIGILQCASNRPLDFLVRSYIDQLESMCGKENIMIIHKNSEGSLINMHTISEQFHHNNHINLFLTVGGGPTQALGQLEKKRPIIIAGVSDPKAYKFDQMSNMYGIIDVFDHRAIFNMVKNSVKNLKNIAIIRSAGEFSEKELLPFKEICHNDGLQYFDHIVYNESDIMFSAEMAAKNGDCVVIPCDTLVVSAFPCIVDIAKKYNKPIVTCFIDGVSMGARCSTGVNYCDYGKNLANLSYTILVRNVFPENKFEISKYDKVYEEVS